MARETETWYKGKLQPGHRIPQWGKILWETVSRFLCPLAQRETKRERQRERSKLCLYNGYRK